ncbi:MAG: hypothetical protein COZ15_00625 [Elusimicrobia bacterium CG_4_10_14_3_um_filter_49_12_50_7]|nr:MAG: hypothetical protein COZ15_00625 [Elusimicrobia bacterium CG_4_10_14_3_um_filter_49_12_50_7]
MSKKKFLFLLLAVVAAGLLWQRLESFRANPAPQAPAPRPKAAPKIACSISGEVANPGVYYLPAGALVGDLISAAGGMTKHADGEKIQRDDFLEDREAIHVPKKSFFKRIGVGEAPPKTYFLPPMEIVEEK